MADTSGQRSRLRRALAGGGVSRSASARPSGVFEETASTNPSGSGASNHHYHHPYTTTGSVRALRATESRFSLHEQFAATRREYEFGDDDAASSLFENQSLAAGAVDAVFDFNGLVEDAVEGERTVVLDVPTICGGNDIADVGDRGPNYYELLCLSRWPPPAPADVWRAYSRLSLLLGADTPQPLSIQKVSFDTRRAVETLLDPFKRAEYNHLLAISGDDDECGQDQAPDLHCAGSATDEDVLLSSLGHGVRSRTDLGLRFDATGAAHLPARTTVRKRAFAPPSDFKFGHSFSMGVPYLNLWLTSRIQSIRLLLARHEASKIPCAEHSLLSPPEDPILTLSTSFDGFVDGVVPSSLALLADSFQPFQKGTTENPHPFSIANRRLSPHLAVRFQQKLPYTLSGRDDQAKPITGQSTTLEVETEVLPRPKLVTRVTRPFSTKKTSQPVLLQAIIKYDLPPTTELPQLVLAGAQDFGGGTVFVQGNSGERSVDNFETCQFFSEFSKISGRFTALQAASTTSPRVEAGYVVGNGAGGYYPDIAVSHARSSRYSRGDWSVFSTATPQCLFASLAYGFDLLSSPSASDPAHSVGRFEVECRSDMHMEGFVATRASKRFGSFTNIGVEVALSSRTLHVSFLWSRLGKNIKVPFLMSTFSSVAADLLFWAVIVPVSCVAAADLLDRRRRAESSRIRRDRIQEELVRNVSRRQRDADELCLAMSSRVAARQSVERRNGGLVIVSAKYGVKENLGSGWAAAEVADVSIAVGALVDGGRLYIPSGVRKSKLPGFWDPGPLATKVLHIRYLYQGIEKTLEASDVDEVTIPSR